ncbi:MAG TPA: ribonuclease HII [Candidatus Omnitrophota bacterium]|nr:ribonuclease HII [Candidatus Omnitrophota bacterium]
MLYYEKQAKKNKFSIIIGVDEAGRGPLAGPVVVAAVYLKKFAFKARIDDSKKLTPVLRNKAFKEIIRSGFYGLGVINEGAIDTINISKAIAAATDNAIGALISKIKHLDPTVKNTFLLFDGTLSSSFKYPSKEIIGGDGKSISIAAASIIAKVSRDHIMNIYGRIWPEYGFSRHKGYGTRQHIKNIKHFGICPIHRRTFCESLA